MKKFKLCGFLIVLCLFLCSFDYNEIDFQKTFSQEKYKELKEYGKINYIIVIDTSLSMSRYFHSVKQGVLNLVKGLNKNDIVTVFTFGTYVDEYILTTKIDNWKDVKYITEYISYLEADQEFTHLGKALRMSRKKMAVLQQVYPYHQNVILLFSDNRDDPPPLAKGERRINLERESDNFKKLKGWTVFTVSAAKKSYKKGADVASRLGGTFIPYRSNQLLMLQIKFLKIIIPILPYLEVLLTIFLMLWLPSKIKKGLGWLSFLMVVGFIVSVIFGPKETIGILHYFYGFAWKLISFVFNFIIKGALYYKLQFFSALLGIILLLIYKNQLKNYFISFKENKKLYAKMKKLEQDGKLDELLKFCKKNNKDKWAICHLGRTKNAEILAREYSKNDSFKKLYNKQIKHIRQNKKHFLVFGTFSSGKSYFLQALTGLPLFESKAVPTTQIPFYLSRGRNQAEIYYKSGKIDKMKSDELKPEYMEKNRFVIEKVWLYLNNKAINSKIVFIDTPGTEAMEGTSFKISSNYMEMVDCILYFMDALKPFSASDKTWIKKLAKYKKRIIFTVSKIDLLDEGENSISEIGEFLMKNIKKQTPVKNPEIIFISSKFFTKGKKSGDSFLSFESNFNGFLRYIAKLV